MLNLEAKAREYREYKRMIEELQDLADGIADELKAALTEAGESKLIVGEYKLSYTDCTRKDIDKNRLEAEHGALYNAYLRETTYKRFAVA
jgi:predicted phage-related endonuclease